MILWLRRNDMALNKSNFIIGRKIRVILKTKFNIDPLKYNIRSLWPDKKESISIKNKSLPKTSAQYEIDITDLEGLYNELIMEFK